MKECAVKSFLFVCTGNICRSPTAEAVFRERVNSNRLPFKYDSAGTHGYHVEEKPDYRSIDIAQKYNVDMSGIYSRKFELSDFRDFDYLIAMDKGHVREMSALSSSSQDINKIKLLLDYHSDHQGMDVPDPYYGGVEDFQNTYELIEKGIDSMIEELS